MATKDEMITPLKFDESFKALLREFYCYGFRTGDQIGTKKKGTFDADWKRLQLILNQYDEDYIHWDQKEGKIICTTMDARSLPINPFHNVYRFCDCKTFEFLLEAVSILSPKIKIRRDFVETDEKRELADFEAESEKNIDEVKEEQGLKISEFLMCCSDADLAYSDPQKTINGRLKALSDQDILRYEQGVGEAGGPGDKRWNLNKLTMNEIFRVGEKTDSAFRNHFISALDFYSRYYFLGEVGAFLLDRIQADDFWENTSSESDLPGLKYESPFRFRQEYLIQALNDFDLLDLLGAIESGNWCLIEYRHAYADKEAENVRFLCYPLEIRISAANGREYLMYYDPIIRSSMSLRLDFICKITYFTDQKVKSVLGNSRLKSSAEEIDTDIKKARDMIAHIWGVSTSVDNNLEGNVFNGQELNDVKITVQYDPVKEPYVKNRLLREGRNGSVNEIEGPGPGKRIEYKISLYDPKEMTSWIRSFASRIVSADFLPGNQGNVNVSDNPQHKKVIEDSAKNNYQKWNAPAEIIQALGNGKKADQHKFVFNEIFSAYGQILATIYTYIISKGEWENDEEWNQDFKEWQDKAIQASNSAGLFTRKLWKEEFTADSIKEIFLYREKKADGKLQCKFEWNKEKLGTEENSVSFYGDILPLTGIEVRWLKTILRDEDKIKCFLSEAEIEAVEGVLNTQRREEKELPAGKIVYFDRYKFPEDCREIEQRVIREFLDLRWNQEKAKIEFHAIPNTSISSDVFRPLKKDDAVTEFTDMKTFSGTFIPLQILFSKRNNFFTLCFWSCDDHKIYFVNASRITSIARTGEKISQDEQKSAEKSLLDYNTVEKHTVELDFIEGQRISDRLLMQLSPWEKDCTFYSSLNKYKIVLSYLTEDEPGLIIRLVGYAIGRNGKNKIEILPPGNTIAREVKRRKKKQQELFDLMGEPEISKGSQHEESR